MSSRILFPKQIKSLSAPHLTRFVVFDIFYHHIFCEVRHWVHEPQEYVMLRVSGHCLAVPEDHRMNITLFSLPVLQSVSICLALQVG